jgi:hypothetical protein
MGMAPMTMSPLAAWLVSNHDWRTSMQIVALVVAAIMIPVALLVRRAPALEIAAAADRACIFCTALTSECSSLFCKVVCKSSSP